MANFTSSPIIVTLTMEALSSSETSVLKATQRNILEDAILYGSHCYTLSPEPFRFYSADDYRVIMYNLRIDQSVCRQIEGSVWVWGGGVVLSNNCAHVTSWCAFVDQIQQKQGRDLNSL
jgi:hypothetical protein